MTAHGDRVRQQILDAIRALTERNTVSPTIREIAELVGLSKSNVFTHLEKLRDEGVVECPRPGAGWRLTG